MTAMQDQQPKYLGHKGNEFKGFDTFDKPLEITRVTMTSDEVTAVCPVTGQPDQYTVRITYYPKALCLESKSLKLYLQMWRNEGIYCEAFAGQIAFDVFQSLDPHAVEVWITQKPRGGVEIDARAMIGEVPLA
jgi:7-cyano-7-deazaguanine reductase